MVGVGDAAPVAGIGLGTARGAGIAQIGAGVGTARVGVGVGITQIGVGVGTAQVGVGKSPYPTQTSRRDGRQGKDRDSIRALCMPAWQSGLVAGPLINA